MVKLKCPFKGTVRGYFDTSEKAVDAIDTLGDLGEEGTYITLNPVSPDLLARANNRFEERAATRAADADVVFRLWLPIDIDPVRPAGISSTEAELQAAKDRRLDVVSYLMSDFGFPEPVMLMSGNGAHALFPVEEPNEPEAAVLFRSILTALDAKFSDDKVKVDTTVHNAARIWTVPGSTKRKGDDMPERPHRVAEIESLGSMELVAREKLQAIGALGTPKRGRPKKTGLPLRRDRGGEILDMQAEFEERGWHITELSPGKHAVKCPWAEEHSSDSGITQTVIYEPESDGEVWGFKCHHSHCAERTIKDVWQSFRPEEEAPEPEQAADERVTAADFCFVAPEDKFLCLPTRQPWTAQAIERRLFKGAANAIAKACSVEQMSWMPGKPLFVDDCIISEGGVSVQQGYRVVNQYRAPDRPKDGNPNDIAPWMEHLMRVFPDTYEHIIAWMAHRIQKPWEKLNHALVLGGKQGIGKDSILEPLKIGVGHSNFAEISPSKLTSEFTGYLQSIVLRVSEARDNDNRFELYERSKTITTAPPDTLRVNEKHTKEYHIPNVTGVIFTTNHHDGLFLPPDDRRHHVSFCENFSKEDFSPEYWKALWNWYSDSNGAANVIAFLEQPERLEGFDAKNPPPKTEAWHEMVTQGCSPEEAELADVLDRMGMPEVMRLTEVIAIAPEDTKKWFNDRKNRRRIPHLMEASGYRSVRSPFAKDGRWVIKGERFVIYALESMTDGERQRKAQAYVEKLDR